MLPGAGGLRSGHRIELRGLRVLGTHGVLSEERARPQPFEIDADVDCDTARRVTADELADELADVVDYGALVHAAVGVVSGPRGYQLLETLADAIAAALLATDGRVARVRVAVRKLRPPVPTELETAGVRVVRSRDERSWDERLDRSTGSGARTFLGLGSNVGDRSAHLRRAVDGLAERGELVAVSALYRSEPVGGPEGQGEYLNLVVELRTTDSARRLLERAHQLEERAGRVRTERFGPRTLDVDLLWMEGVSIAEPDLVVPHPRLWQRRFVLAPLAELAPEMVTADALALSGGSVRRAGTLRS